MKLNTKVKAFTLSEMVVVLILTAIVVGLAFSVLSLVQKQMRAIQSNYSSNLELNKLETSLWLDFNRYSKITFNDDDNEMKFSSEIDSITYMFNEKTVIKANDTFPLAIKSKQVYFDGELIDNGAIDAIKLELDQASQNKKLFICKRNDAAQYMND